MTHITFKCEKRWLPVFDQPSPAINYLPEWFKRCPHDVDTPINQFPVGTVRRCMPAWDFMTLGYIIPLPIDLHVWAGESKEQGSSLNWRGDWKLVDQHDDSQAPEFKEIYKLMNPWSITTEPGWSTLFIPPVYHNLPFQPFPAVVDTDTYKNYINFPFTWTKYPHDDVLPGGTPFIQAIPFRREERSQHNYTISSLTDDDLDEIRAQQDKVRTHQHTYKKEYRETDK